jgi:hypothetical protein
MVAPACFGLVFIAYLILWIMALVDVLRRQFPDPNTKIIWLLVIIFVHGIGAILYFLIGRNQGTLPV